MFIINKDMERHTRQERMLTDSLNTFGAFFTAEELAVKTQGTARIGTATVYRFLKKKELSGEVHSYLCGRRRLYSVNEDNHCHFTCSKCGRVEHLKLSKVDFIKDATNGKVCHFQLDITGICKRCLSEVK